MSVPRSVRCRPDEPGAFIPSARAVIDMTDRPLDVLEETLDRVEEVETEAQRAVEDADVALRAVDDRLNRFDEMISLLEAEIEAVFSIGFFYFAFTQWTAGNELLAGGLLLMGLLGASSLAVTVYKMPQVRKLRRVGRYASRRLEARESDEGADDATNR